MGVTCSWVDLEFLSKELPSLSKSQLKVNVLGTEYKIEYKKREDDEQLEESDGYCDTSSKLIVVEDMKLEKGSKKDLKTYAKQVLRHEIIHAFLHESGLDNCSLVYSAGWAKSEEMVDWIALQSPKMLKAFKEADCI